MRPTLTVFLVLIALLGASAARAQLEVGSPETAFAGGPIKLSKNAVGVLRAHYQGDKVPLVPQPFRGRLDTALAGRDWPRVEAVKKDLIAADGLVAALAWEQSRFIATGSIGVAEMHALDVAATGNTGLSETAVMLWFYAAAVTLTDGHKCVDEAARDAHFDKLRGPLFEPVLRLVRTISDDRLAAMRDLAIRLETVLAPDRTDDLMCRVGNGPADIKPDALWRPDASLTRAMLPRHLIALAAVMRPRPIARAELPKPDAVKPALARSEAARRDPEPVIEPLLPWNALALPIPDAPTFAPSSPVPNGSAGQKAAMGKGPEAATTATLGKPAAGGGAAAKGPGTEAPTTTAVAPAKPGTGGEPAAQAASTAAAAVSAAPAAAPASAPPAADRGAADGANQGAVATSEPHHPDQTRPASAGQDPPPPPPVPATTELVNRHAGRPDPTRFEPPRLELTPAEPTPHP